MTRENHSSPSFSSSVSKDRKSNIDANRRVVTPLEKENEIDRRRREIAKQKEAREKQIKVEVCAQRFRRCSFESFVQAENFAKKQRESIDKDRRANIKRDRERYRLKLTESTSVSSTTSFSDFVEGKAFDFRIKRTVPINEQLRLFFFR